jgi:hypothetical protein
MAAGVEPPAPVGPRLHGTRTGGISHRASLARAPFEGS